MSDPSASAPELLGLVLCGGRSQRMGADKGLLETRGTPWAKRAARKLAPLTDRVALSINPDQEIVYSFAFADLRLIVDDGRAPGPLGALLSAHASQKCDLFVLAVDLLDLQTETLRLIISHARAGDSAVRNSARVVCFAGEAGLEPLCAFYSAAALERLAAALAENRLNGFSLQQIGNFIEAQTLSLGERAKEFRNYNTPEDTRGLI